MKYTKLILALFVLGTLSISASSTHATTATSSVKLSFTNLTAPSSGHYEGWLIVDGSPVSTGKFTVDTNGNIVDLNGKSIDSFSVSVDISKASKFVLTLEPKDDADTAPSSIKFLAGDLNSDKTSASLAPNLGVDLSGVAGKYLLATPTNGADTDENAGIWWLDPSTGTPAASLNLPDLTGTDWTYEGWVVVDGQALTAGTFDKATGADNSAPYSGDMAAPPFPGEDYLKNAPTGVTFPVDLAGGKAVISIEPRMDNDPAPFLFKPLVGDIPSNAVDHTLYSMTDMSATMPTGTVSIQTMQASTSSSSLPFANQGFVAVILLASALVTANIRRKY